MNITGWRKKVVRGSTTLKSCTEHISEGQDILDNCTVIDEQEVLKEQLSNLTDYQSLEHLGETMVKAALDGEEVVTLTWRRDEVLRLAGVLHRLTRDEGSKRNYRRLEKTNI